MPDPAAEPDPAARERLAAAAAASMAAAASATPVPDADGPDDPFAALPVENLEVGEPLWTRRRALGLLGLLFGTVLFYWRTRSFDLLSLDDLDMVTTNPYIRELSWANLRMLFTPGFIPIEQLYIPLPYLTYLFDTIRAGGVDSATLHATNAWLHGLNAVLLWILTWRLSGRTWAAWVAAIAFVVQPLQIEPVAWVAARKEVLSAAFGLATLLAWLRWVDLRERRFWALAWVLAALAMLSKPSMLVLPGLLAVLELYRQGLPPKSTLRAWTLQGVWYLPFLVLAVGIYWLNTQTGAPAPVDPPSLGFRLACLPWVLGKMLARVALIGMPIPYYRWPDRDMLGIILAVDAAVLLGGLAVVFVAWTRQMREVLFGLSFFLVALVPAGMIVLGARNFLTADRYAYFPLIGLCYLVGRAVEWAPRDSQILVRFVTILWLIASASLNLPMQGAWRDSYSLWHAVARRDDGAAIAHYNIGRLLEEDADVDGAVLAYTRALRLDAGYWKARYNRGNLLRQSGDVAGAEADYMQVLQARPGQVDVMVNLGTLYLERGDANRAGVCFNQALLYESPYEAMIHINLARTALIAEDWDAADAQLQHAAAIADARADGMAWMLIGNVRMSMDQTALARTAFRRAQDLGAPLSPAALAIANGG